MELELIALELGLALLTMINIPAGELERSGLTSISCLISRSSHKQQQECTERAYLHEIRAYS